ncbi:MAG: hypothetical protein KGK44_11400 [Gammaproteobacteria bacterium]|nr:hypothetical protein [Gammaproteobacteria bacterium]
MNETTSTPKLTTLWHVWLVGVLALIWNCMNAFDYFMTTTHFYSFPMWVDISWGLYVLAGILGAVALLFRKRWAVAMFTVSLAAMVITSFYIFATSGFSVEGGMGALIFTAITFIIAIGLLIYARLLARKNILN